RAVLCAFDDVSRECRRGSACRRSVRRVGGGAPSICRVVRARHVTWNRIPQRRTPVNNLHRELAPISDAAWAQIDEETTRTLKRYLAGRRVVDVPSAGGIALPGVGTGHLKQIASPAEGILARQREVKPLVEL